MGDRSMLLTRAREAIRDEIGSLEATSSIYETEAWGKLDQPNYLNQVVALSTPDLPEEVLEKAMKIEQALGRERNEKWGARTLDIDVLFFEDRRIDQPNLTIPHPELHNRRFVLVPLNEIAPDLVHPVKKKSIKDLLNEVADDLIVIRWSI